MNSKLRLLTTVCILLLTVFSFSVASAGVIPANDNAKDRAKAPQKSEAISDNWELVRVDFIHYAKPENPGGGKGGGGKNSGPTCYKLMGVKWKQTPVSYVINPTNPDGLSISFVTTTIAASFETWDAETSTELFVDSYSVDSTAEFGIQDYINVIDFGNYDTGVIGVTSVWYTLKGRQIVEFDMRLNTDFAWGDADVETTPVMDLANIVTHEAGHTLGMADIYSDTCSTVTMYGYSNYDEIMKRTLEAPDIEGLQKMYGA